MGEPLVTIGMPVYNGSAYVAEAVGSLLAQTERDLVLLISDDRSTDETPEICEGLAASDRRVRFVRHEEHLGMTRNFQWVLDQAEAPFFLWAAQDDRWAPDFLEETLGLLERAPAALGAMSAIAFVHPGDEPIRTVRIPAAMASRDPVRRARAVRSDGFHAIYALFRRERLLATGVRLLDVPAPDLPFVFGVVLHGPIVSSDRELSTRRVIGYERVVASDGRVAWEKALGPDGRLYAWARTDSARAMARHLDAVPLATADRLRLRASILRVWAWGAHRNLAEQTGRVPITRAWAGGRYFRAGLMAAAQAVLRPRLAYREARRMLGR